MQRLVLDLNAYHSANRAYGAGHPGNSRAAMEKTEGGASATSYVFSNLHSNFWLIFGKFLANFERLVLGCIEAEFCKQILV